MASGARCAGCGEAGRSCAGRRGNAVQQSTRDVHVVPSKRAQRTGPQARRSRRRASSVARSTDLGKRDPKELFSMVHEVHAIRELAMQCLLARKRILGIEHRVNVELERHGSIAQLSNPIHRIESPRHSNLNDLGTKAAMVRDHRRCSPVSEPRSPHTSPPHSPASTIAEQSTIFDSMRSQVSPYASNMTHGCAGLGRWTSTPTSVPFAS